LGQPVETASLSKGCDSNTLTHLPGVEMDGDDYFYTGGNSYSSSLGSKISTSGILGYSGSVEILFFRQILA